MNLRIVALLVLVCVSCRPDVPTRGCSDDEDCFTQERCVRRLCVDRSLLPDVSRSDGEPEDGPITDVKLLDLSVDVAADVPGPDASPP